MKCKRSRDWGTRFVGCSGLVEKVDALGQTIFLISQKACCFCLVYDFRNICCFTTSRQLLHAFSSLIHHYF